MRTQLIVGRAAIVLLVLFLGQSVNATDYYMGIDGIYQRIDIAGEEFNPTSTRLRGGLWLWRGIAVEASIAAAVSDDTTAGLTLETPTVVSIYARFQSPKSIPLRAYMMLGFSSIEIEGKLDDDEFPGSERFTGPSAAIGLQDELPWFSNSSVNLEVTGHFVDSDIDMLNASLGFHYEF